MKALPFRRVVILYSRRNDELTVGQRCNVASSDPRASRNQVIQALKLAKANCGLNIGDAKVVAHFGISFERRRIPSVPLEVSQRHALVTQHAQPVCQGLVIRNDHAALTGRHDLAGMQTEYGDRRKTTNHASAEPAAERAGGILNNDEPMLVGKLENSIDLARKSDLVYRENSACAWANLSGHIVGIDVVGVRINVGKYRFGTAMRDHVDGSNEGERRYDHFITGSQSERLEDQKAAGGPRRYAKGMSHTAQGRKALF